MLVWSLAWRDPLEKAKATHSIILAWLVLPCFHYSLKRFSFIYPLIFVQWLGLQVFAAEGLGSIPGWRTNPPQAVWRGQKEAGLRVAGDGVRGGRDGGGGGPCQADLSSPRKDWIQATAAQVPSPNHRASRELPDFCLF